MSQQPRLRLAAIAAVLLLVACRPAPPTSTSLAATPAATNMPPDATALAAGADLDAIAWADRSTFRAGLAQSQQAVLDRLPGASVYHIAITLTQGLDTVRGHEAMQYTNQTGGPLDQIVFHLFPNLLAGSMAVSNIAVDGASATGSTLDQRGTILRLPLSKPLASNGRAIVAMDFQVAVPHDLQRNYGVFAYNQDILALSHFFPLVAVYDQRGWNVEIPARSVT